MVNRIDSDPKMNLPKDTGLATTVSKMSQSKIHNIPIYPAYGKFVIKFTL